MDSTDYPIPGVRLAGGRALHWVKDPGEYGWGGWLETACGKAGSQGTTYGIRRTTPTACKACKRVLGIT